MQNAASFLNFAINSLPTFLFLLCLILILSVLNLLVPGSRGLLYRKKKSHFPPLNS